MNPLPAELSLSPYISSLLTVIGGIQGATLIYFAVVIWQLKKQTYLLQDALTRIKRMEKHTRTRGKP